MLRSALSTRRIRCVLFVLGIASAFLVLSAAAGPTAAAPGSDADLRREFVRHGTRLTNDLTRLKKSLDAQPDTLLEYIDRLNPFAVARKALLRDAKAAKKALRAARPASSKAKKARKQALGAAAALRRSSVCWGDFLDDVLAAVDQLNPFAYVREALGGEEVLRAKADCGWQKSEQATNKLTKANKLLGRPIAPEKLARAKLPEPAEDLPVAVGFAITSVSLPGSITGGSAGTLTVSWAGDPSFPVTMVYAPDVCPSGWSCATPASKFSTPANPLVFPGAIWCTSFTGDPAFFDYSVYLVDATGRATPRHNADFTCLPSS